MLVLPVSRLITIIPCLLIVPLTRGATIEICLAAILTIFTLLALTVSLNLFCSVLFKEHSTSRIFADSLLLLLLALLPAISYLNSAFLGTSIPQEWLCLNPGYAPWLFFDSPHSNRNLPFIYLSLLFSSALALALFAAAAFRVSRLWKDRSPRSDRSVLASILDHLRRRRATRARPCLDSNPYEWLIYRDSHPMLVSVLVLNGLAFLWLVGLWQWGASWFIPMNFWITFLLLSVVIRAMANYIAARQIGIDRNTGGLELILTSPLSVEEILAGQQNALRRYIRPFYWLAGLMLLAFWLIGLFVLPMTHTQKIHFTILTSLVAIFGPWYSIQQFWPAFWVSLNTARPALYWRTSAWQKGYFIWIFFALLRRGSWSKIPTGSYGEGIFIAVCSVGALIGYIIYRYSHKPYSVFPLRDLALKHMRAIAAEPIPEANDPRLKNWNQQTPLFPIETSYEKLPRPLSPTTATQ